MKLEELVGQQMMIGIPGTRVTPEILDTFRETMAGGVIFFRPNFSSASKFRSLISNLEAGLGRKLVTAVDHEGGRVIHLREGITVFPDNLALGQTQKEEYAVWQGEIEARELRRLGIDLNLAPTVDVLTKSFSPNIGIRSYGHDPELVGKLGSARIRMVQALGLSACAKHFPGQGQSPADAHLGLPVLPTTPADMKKIHLKPFVAAIEAGVHAIMTSHPVYPKLDPKKQPATFSRRIVHGLLRKKLGFEGLILSDDLEMGALKGICGIGESAVRAIEAGHDMVLVCHDRNAQFEVSKALLKAYRSGRLDKKELEASTERIRIFRQNHFFRFGEGRPFAEPRGAELASKIAGEAVVIFHPERSEGSLSIIFPRLSSLSHLIHIENECLNEKAFIKRLFNEKGISPKEIEIIGFEPDESEIKRAEALAKKCETTIFFCYDAHLFAGTRQLLGRIQKIARNCIVILLRDPYDKKFVSKKNTCITAFGFRKVQIEAVVGKITC